MSAAAPARRLALALTVSASLLAALPGAGLGAEAIVGAEPEDPPGATSTPPEQPVGPAPPGALPPRQPPEPALEPAPPELPPPGLPPAGPAGASPAEAAQEDTWLDVGHAFIEQRLFAPILRFDRFFSDERPPEAERARSFLQVRNDLKIREHGEPTSRIVVRANLRLPGVNRALRRLRVVIAGQTEEALSTFLPEGASAALRGNDAGSGSAELRFGAWEGIHSSVDLGTGFLFEVPPGVFSRVRYRASVPVRGLVLFRFATSGFWRSDTRFGTSVDADLERPLGPASVIRLSGAGLLTERSRGIEWVSELGAAREVGPRAALSLAGAADGAGRSPVAVERWRIYSRYRRDVFRRWIYVELEPVVAWPWTAPRGRFREIALTVRLEVQFQGNEPPIPPPRRIAEPADPPRGCQGACRPSPPS